MKRACENVHQWNTPTSQMALLLFAHRTESGVCVCVCVCVSVPDTDRYFKAVYFTGKTSVL